VFHFGLMPNEVAIHESPLRLAFDKSR